MKTITLHSAGQILSAVLLLSAITACKPKPVVPAEVVSDDVRMLITGLGPADSATVRLYSFDQESGTPTQLSSLRGIADPSFLIYQPSTSRFYVCSETNNDSDALVACKLEGANLSIINAERTRSMSPCYVNLDPRRNVAYTTNYNGGSVSRFTYDPKTGALDTTVQVFPFEGSGPFLPNQTQAHCHCVEFTPDSSLLIVDDLGSDRIHLYSLREQRALPDVEIRPGSGPRHITFAPDGRHAYLMNELSGFVTVLAYNDSTLTPIQYAQCDSVGGAGSADIHITRDGRFLYASNRLKADGISIFSINAQTGLITKVGYQNTGIHPRNFALSPNDKYLLCACRDSNAIQIFSRNPETGMLTDTGIKIEMDKPVCVKFL